MNKFTILTAAILATTILLPATSQAGTRYGGVFLQGVSLNGTDGANPPNAARVSEREVRAVTLPDGSVVETPPGIDGHDQQLFEAAKPAQSLDLQQ